MKAFIIMILAALLLQPATLQASSRRDTLRGGLVGAATGALVSELSSDISARTAIPVFAGVGALTGYARHRYRHQDYYGYSPHLNLQYGRHPYHHPVGYRQRYSRRFRPQPPVQVAPLIRSAIRIAEADRRRTTSSRHPGVSRIPVSFETETGFPLTITITKVGNQYVGPRGETYSEMPTIKQLQQTYKP